MRPAVSFDAIIAADLHIREDTPVCRTDDFPNAQFAKLVFIQDLCERHNCPFLVAGDVLHHWRPSPFLLSRCLELLPAWTVCVPGQHDLMQHSLREYAKTGLNTLQQAGRVLALMGGRSARLSHSRPCPGVVIGYGYGETAKNTGVEAGERQILLWHRLVCKGRQPWPGAGADEALNVLRSLPGYDLIVTGDNHQQFLVELNDGRKLLNPGSLTRMTSDQAQFEPAVWGWRASDNKLIKLLLPLTTGAVSDEHLPDERTEDRDARLDAYIERARKQFEVGLSFEENLKAHFRANKEPKRVEQLTWKAVGS